MKNLEHWLPALVVGLLLLFAVSRPTQVTVQEQPDINTIQVSGTAQLKADADLGVISFAVESKAANAKAAEDMNRKTGNTLQAALRAAGINASEMQTLSYTLYEDKRYNHQTGNYESYGYIASHALEIRTKRITELGSFIDVAVRSGANRVDNVYFELSDEAKVATRSRALNVAAKMARSKADALASSLGVSVGKAVQISESEYGVTPYYARGLAMDMAESAKSEPTQIDPGEVTISATVSASFELK